MKHQYRHFKGNLYTLLDVGYCPDNEEFYVLYKRAGHPSSETFGWCRNSETEEVIYFQGHNREIDVDALNKETEVDREELIQEAINSGLWIRPLDMFFGMACVDGKMVQRFERVIE